MMKIQYLALVLLPCFYLGCQNVEGDKEASLVYFFTDQDGSQVPLEGDSDVVNEEKPSSQDEKGFITRIKRSDEESKKEKKGGLFSFFGKGKDEQEPKGKKVSPVEKAQETLPSERKGVEDSVVIEAPEISGELKYPSIVAPVAAPKVEEKPLAKPYKVIDLGEEKIRVIDRGMGSVEAEDVKKLRGQGGR